MERTPCVIVGFLCKVCNSDEMTVGVISYNLVSRIKEVTCHMCRQNSTSITIEDAQEMQAFNSDRFSVTVLWGTFSVYSNYIEFFSRSGASIRIKRVKDLERYAH